MNLLDKLPHKAPALLLDDVLDVDETGATCAIVRAPHASLAPDGLLPAPLGLEVMAQAAAAWMCWRYPAEPCEGMLVQCRDFEMKVRRLNVSAGLRVEAKPLSVGSATGLYMFAGKIMAEGGDVLASSTFLLLVRKKP